MCWKFNKIQFLLVALTVLFNGLLPDTNAQSPAEFQHYKELYPSNPYIRLQDEATFDIQFDKQGKPIFLVKETDVVMVLEDNLTELSRIRKYFNSRTEIKKIDAYSLVSIDGKIKKIKMPEMKKLTDYDDTYFDDYYCMEGNFPAIGKGTILYYSSEYIRHDAEFGISFYFGSSAPVEHTSLTVNYPDNIQLINRFAGSDTAQIHQTTSVKGNIITRNWSCDRLKGYFSDKLAPSGNYYQPHVLINVAEYNFKGENYRLMGNIDDLFRWEANKLKNVNVKFSPEVKLMADSITRGCNTAHEKVEKIYKWVQEKIRYIAIEDGDNGFVPREASTVLSRRYGDCKDKASLLTALIKSVGEEASFTVVGTRKLPYSFSEYPAITSGNHLIATWWDENNQPIILDGTALHYKPGDIPPFIQGKECLIVKDSANYVLYKIPVDEPEINLTLDTLTLQIDGKHLTGTGVSVSRGDLRANLIRQSEGKSQEQKKEIVSGMLGYAGNKMEITNCNFSELSGDNAPFIIKYGISLPDYCVVSGDRLYVNLNLNQQLSNLDIKSDRTVPIESENTYLNMSTTKLTIPEGYTVSSMPENAVYTHPEFSFSITYKTVNNTIIQDTRLRIAFLLLEGEEIGTFRDMIKQLNQAYRKTVMLQKTGK